MNTEHTEQTKLTKKGRPRLKSPGRPPMRPEDRRRRVFMRLELPPEKEWKQMLRKAGYREKTQFFQEAVDQFLRSQAGGNQ
jgi:hypothetical protein